MYILLEPPPHFWSGLLFLHSWWNVSILCPQTAQVLQHPLWIRPANVLLQPHCQGISTVNGAVEEFRDRVLFATIPHRSTEETTLLSVPKVSKLRR